MLYTAKRIHNYLKFIGLIILQRALPLFSPKATKGSSKQLKQWDANNSAQHLPAGCNVRAGCAAAAGGQRQVPQLESVAHNSAFPGWELTSKTSLWYKLLFFADHREYTSVSIKWEQLYNQVQVIPFTAWETFTYSKRHILYGCEKQWMLH